MMSSNPWFNHSPVGAVGATGAASYGATGATAYPYSALSPHAKQAEDREAEIERIARLMAVARDGEWSLDLLVVPANYEFLRTLDGCYIVPFNDPNATYKPVVPYWRTFYRAAEAVYEDRHK